VTMVVLCFAQLGYAAKKGGEPCADNSECETQVCKDGTCDPCPDPESNCPKPGMCTWSDYRDLRSKVGPACKSSKLTCVDDWSKDDNEADCNELQRRKEQADKCATARDDLMQRCFKGGNSKHREERDNAKKARDWCQELSEYKKGKNICYTCSQSDYESYNRDVRNACSRELVCDERKDDSKVDCSRIDDRARNGQACLEAADYIVTRCFNGNRSDARQRKRDKTDEKRNNCREVLDYKKSNDLCQ
jgi:hypothetical protein